MCRLFCPFFRCCWFVGEFALGRSEESREGPFKQTATEGLLSCSLPLSSAGHPFFLTCTFAGGCEREGYVKEQRGREKWRRQRSRAPAPERAGRSSGREPLPLFSSVGWRKAKLAEWPFFGLTSVTSGAWQSPPPVLVPLLSPGRCGQSKDKKQGWGLTGVRGDEENTGYQSTTPCPSGRAEAMSRAGPGPPAEREEEEPFWAPSAPGMWSSASFTLRPR